MEEDERAEAIEELLADVTQESVKDLIKEVLTFWNGILKTKTEEAEEKKHKALEAAKGNRDEHW